MIYESICNKLLCGDFSLSGRRIDRPGEADRAIDAGGFVTSVTDENGVHHELGSNSFAFITVLDQEDVQRLAQGLGSWPWENSRRWRYAAVRTTFSGYILIHKML